jgi:hypothetical protein
MEWQVLVALALAIPLIMFPAAYVWYMNLGNVLVAVRKGRKARSERGAAEPTVLINTPPGDKT